MKINQKTALLLAVLLVIGSAWGKAKLTFSSMQKQLDVIYTEGIDQDGQSIAQDVKEKQKTARNCVTVARRYDSAINASFITAVEKAAINFGKPEEKWLDDLDTDEARRYMKEGHFAPGSMLPKVQAAVKFAESKPGRTSLITLLEKAKERLQKG